jgi:hypothetical protein
VLSLRLTRSGHAFEVLAFEPGFPWRSLVSTDFGRFSRFVPTDFVGQFARKSPPQDASRSRWQSSSRSYFPNWRQHQHITNLALIHQSDSWLANTEWKRIIHLKPQSLHPVSANLLDRLQRNMDWSTKTQRDERCVCVPAECFDFSTKDYGDIETLSQKVCLFRAEQK